MHHPGVSRRGNAKVCLYIVIPAQAGTHNHRALCCAEVVEQHPSRIGRGVWSRLKAGTTLRENAVIAKATKQSTLLLYELLCLRSQ